MKKLLLLVLAIVLSACSAVANAGQPNSELQEARERWDAANISHYRFNVHISCFCIFVENMPLAVEVQNGEVVSMGYSTGAEIDPQFLELFNRYVTVERLFEGIEAGFAVAGDDQEAADQVTVTYDETYGYPTQIDIDFVEEAIDDELYISVSDFEALP